MKITILIVLFLFVVLSSYTQKNIPTLIGKDYNKEKIIIKDTIVTDSLKVFFQIVVDFKSPLKDTTQCIIIEAVNILRMSVTSLTNNEQVIPFSYDNEKGTFYQKYIWNLCNNKFNNWYKNQSYRMLDNRSKWGNRVVFGGTLYIKPH